MITKDDVKKALSCQEGQCLEFKESKEHLSKEFWKTYSAFANTNGGLVLLGVQEDENKTAVIVGVDNPDKIRTELFSTLSNPTKVSLDVISQDNVQVFEIDNKYILSLYIPEAPINKKPVYINGAITSSFIRKHETDCKISEDELAALIRNKSEDLDSELLEGYTIEDLDPASIANYKSRLSSRYPNQLFDNMSAEDFLKSIGIIAPDYNDHRKLKLRLGGLLFFGKYNAITSRLPHYFVDFQDKRGNGERWADRVHSGDLSFPDMNLFNYYNIVLEKLLNSINRSFQLDYKMERKSYADLDIALRETFVNMIVHADYLSDSTALLVEVHNPYYIFTNPGIMKIPAGSFFKCAQSHPRNNILIQLFTRLGAVERAGSGSQKIKSVVVKNDFKTPDISTTLEKTVFRLWIANAADVTPDLGDVEKEIYRIFNSNPYNRDSLSAREIEAIFPQYNHSKIMRALRTLHEKDLILKHGGNKNRTYSKAVSPLELLKNFELAGTALKNLF